MATNAVGATGGTLNISKGLVNIYTNANATTSQGQRRFQVVRVPHYSSVTSLGSVTAAAWNGTTGGIVALDVAGNLNLNGGSINVSAQGFRGGGGRVLAGGTGTNTDYRTSSYFLCDGGQNATNVQICDLVPANTTFVADSFAVGQGIALASNSTSIPTAPTATFTNTADTDSGQFYSPGTSVALAACNRPSFTSPLPAGSNVSGVVLVNVVKSPTALPKTITPGSPFNSYGFIRFRVKVN